MKNVLISSAILLSLLSCQSELDNFNETETNISNLSLDKKSEAFKEFSSILAKALNDFRK